MLRADLDLVVAGTRDAVLMIESEAKELSEAQMIDAIIFGQEGYRPVIDAIEALGIAPTDASPAYWRTLGNRLAAREPLPPYTAERHAAWLAGRALS